MKLVKFFIKYRLYILNSKAMLVYLFIRYINFMPKAELKASNYNKILFVYIEKIIT